MVFRNLFLRRSYSGTNITRVVVLNEVGACLSAATVGALFIFVLFTSLLWDGGGQKKETLEPDPRAEDYPRPFPMFFFLLPF